MDTIFQTNTSRLGLYLSEIEHWLKLLSDNIKELPHLSTLLSAKTNKLGDTFETSLLESEIQKQQLEILQAHKALTEQQLRLQKDNDAELVYDIASLCSQDILREQVKETEKRYIDLKCRFMSFLGTLAN